MTDADTLAAQFEAQRPRLQAVAARMLGSRADAEDAVQNAWLRLSGIDPDEVDNLSGWLTTVVARECLKVMRSRRTRREQPLPEASAERLPGPGADEPEAQALLADAVAPALVLVLDTLTPAERLAFVLHDVFGMPFTDIAGIVERSPGAARQLASRARRRVHGAAADEPADLPRERRVVDAFLAALHDGDIAGLLAVLDPDVTLHDDAGGTTTTQRGADEVAGHAAGFSWGARFARPALVDGAPGVVIIARGRTLGALGFTYRGDRIVHIEVIGRPEPDEVVAAESG